jgi:hypothetical protein
MTYDEWLEAPYMRQDADPEVCEDEGIAVLSSALKYLEPRILADEDEQLIGAFEAGSILAICIDKCKWDYQCHFCGVPINRRRDKYCSRNCYKADHEGY